MQFVFCPKCGTPLPNQMTVQPGLATTRLCENENCRGLVSIQVDEQNKIIVIVNQGAMVENAKRKLKIVET